MQRREKAANMGGEKLRVWVWGMHILEIGKESELWMADGLMAHDWTMANKEG